VRRPRHFAPPALPAGSLERVEVPDSAWSQGCTSPPGCPDAGLDASRCLTDPSPFTPTVLDGEVVSVTVDEATVSALGLAPGAWWAAWSDGVSCERVVATFVVAEPEVTP